MTFDRCADGLADLRHARRINVAITEKLLPHARSMIEEESRNARR